MKNNRLLLLVLMVVIPSGDSFTPFINHFSMRGERLEMWLSTVPLIDIYYERNYTYISNLWLIGKEIAYYYIIIGEWRAYCIHSKIYTLSCSDWWKNRMV